MSAIARLARDPSCLMAIDALGGARWLSPVKAGQSTQLTYTNAVAADGVFRAADTTQTLSLGTPVDLRGRTAPLTIIQRVNIPDDPWGAGMRLAIPWAQGSNDVVGAAQTLGLELRTFTGSETVSAYLRYRAADGAVKEAHTTTALIWGAWHVLAVEIDPAASTAAVWLDGVRYAVTVATGGALGSGGTVTSLHIGSSVAATVSRTAMAVQCGSMMAYSRTLGADEIAAITKIIGGR